jgi:hypothetical protein
MLPILSINAEIHGVDGLGGVEGLLPGDSNEVRARFGNEPVRALDGMSQAIRQTWRSGHGTKITVVSTGPMTNIALFISVYPELLEAIEELVFMGGGIGIGNRSAVAGMLIMAYSYCSERTAVSHRIQHSLRSRGGPNRSGHAGRPSLRVQDDHGVSADRVLAGQEMHGATQRHSHRHRHPRYPLANPESREQA